MSKFTILMALLFLSTSAAAQTVMSPDVVKKESVVEVSQRNLEEDFKSIEAGIAPVKKMVPNIGAMRIVPPSNDEKVITETPEGEMSLYSKQGVSYGASILGMITQAMNSGLSNIVKSEDGKKWYIQNPVFFFYNSETSWIEADVAGNVLSINLPQLVYHRRWEYDYDKDGTIDEVIETKRYLLKVAFEVEKPEEGTGWFYPTEDQTFRFNINSDGSLESLESEDVMLGVCAWIESANEDDEGYYSWQGYGDIVMSAREVTEEAAELPSSVEMEDWSLIKGITYSTVKVGFEGDTVYIAGFFEQMPDALMVGKLNGSTIEVSGPQYMGVYSGQNTLAYFIVGNMVTVNQNGEDFSYVDAKDHIDFSYDSSNKVITTEGAYCVSTAPDVIQSYYKHDKPYIFIQQGDVNVTALQSPVITTFFDVDENYGTDAYIGFNFPIVDADRHILDTAKLYYEVIVDEEPYEFYNDVYSFPDDIEEITQIPFDFGDLDMWIEDPSYEDGGYTLWAAIYNYGISHYIRLRGVRDFESLGIRTLYKNNDDIVYSDIVWCEGYSTTTGVQMLETERTIVDVMYFDMLGNRIQHPTNGIYIRHTVYDDGKFSSSKIRVR